MNVNAPEFIEEVCAHVRTAGGFEAETEFMGGGIICICVQLKDGVSLYFGTANENWGADIYVDGEFVDGEYLETPLPISEDPATSAGTIISAIQEFSRARAAILVKNHGGKWIKECAQEGINAFWCEVAKKNPDIRTGDFPPELVHLFQSQAENMVKEWLRLNS